MKENTDLEKVIQVEAKRTIYTPISFDGGVTYNKTRLVKIGRVSNVYHVCNLEEEIKLKLDFKA